MASMTEDEFISEVERRSGKDRPISSSTHVDDVGLYEETDGEIGDASWGEVFRACCCHSPQEWGMITIGLLFLGFFLYFFLFGLALLGSSAKVIGGCTAGSLMGENTNPIAALMVGIIATVLLQSSSTTTSIVVSLVGSEAIPAPQAIYMIMGANVGTSVTNTIVAMGQVGDGDQLELAFAGATVHDLFNMLTVAILLPLEWATGFLYYLTRAMVGSDSVTAGERWEGPVKKLVAPLAERLIIANKKLIEEVAKGDTCDTFYPVNCTNGIVDEEHCKVGLIGCDEKTGNCPVFFQDGARQKDDEVSGWVCFVFALVILVVCLIGLVTMLQRMLIGVSTRIIFKATSINGYVAIVIGAALTLLVQSSSITTSTLTPLVGMGVLGLDQMFPLTLGSNLGTTVTALLAATVSDSVDALQVALAHLFFNVFGIIIWYPIPFMRAIPLGGARRLGKATRVWRGFPIIYVLVMFFLLPLALLGLSSLFEQDSIGFTVLGALITLLLGVFLSWSIWQWNFRGGRERFVERIKRRQRKNAAIQDLADDMEYLKAQVATLTEHMGLLSDHDGDTFEDEEHTDGNTGEKAVAEESSLYTPTGSRH